MKGLTTALIIASIAMTTIVQAQTYKWEDGYCSMQGNFDSKKYTAKQIENSHYVMSQLSTLNLEILSTPQSATEMKQLSYGDVDALDKEYAQVKNDIEKLQIVPQAQTYKQNLLKTIEGEYTTNKLVLLAYVDPVEAIKQSPAMCKTYIEPLLQSESAIQNRWRKAVEEKIKEQAKDYADDPDLIKSQRKFAMDRYQEEKAANASFYAHKDLISYHFNNCLVNTAYRVDSDFVFADSQKLNKALFGKSFKEICDED